MATIVVPTPKELHPGPEDTPTQTYIKNIALLWLDLVCKQDFDFVKPEAEPLLSALAPDFFATVDAFNGKLTIQQLGALWKQEDTEAPKVGWAIKSATINVDEKRGKGTLWMEHTTTIPGMERGIRGFLELEWVRGEGEKWLLKRFHGMRGVDMDNDVGGGVMPARTRNPLLPQ